MLMFLDFSSFSSSSAFNPVSVTSLLNSVLEIVISVRSVNNVFSVNFSTGAIVAFFPLTVILVKFLSVIVIQDADIDQLKILEILSVLYHCVPSAKYSNHFLCV